MRVLHATFLALLLLGPPAGNAETFLNDGEVRAIDRAAGEIVIRHGRLNQFDMPPMVMAFVVRDRRLFDKARPGDRIRFLADIVEGRFTVTHIEVVESK